MIDRISIKNFKTLKDVCVSLKPLNLLTGLNGTGKSSFIQVLLLLRQSVLNTALVKGYLGLNGNLIQLGKGKEVLYQYAEKEDIEIKLNFSNTATYHWNMNVDMEVEYLEPKKKNDFDYHSILDEALFQDDFQYLNTEHIGPQEVYQTSLSIIRKKQLGWKGEYTVHFLNAYGNRFVPAKELQHPKAKSEKLLFRTYGKDIAELNFYKKNQNLSQINSNSNQIRDIYESQNITGHKLYLSIDIEKGAFEVCDYRGRHLKEILFNGDWNGIAQANHSIKLKA